MNFNLWAVIDPVVSGVFVYVLVSLATEVPETACQVVAGLFVLGGSGYFIRRRYPHIYGLLEIMMGLALGTAAFPDMFPIDDGTQVARSIIVSTFLIVRGITGLDDRIRHSRLGPIWFKVFGSEAAILEVRWPEWIARLGVR